MIAHDDNVDPRGLRAVEQLVSESICGSAHYFHQVGSTNTLALDLAKQYRNQPDLLPSLVIADSQTAGRGRHGRTWLSGPNNLAFSLILAPTSQNEKAAGLWSLAVGIAIAQTLEYEFAPIKTQLKWPNDVYLGGGKVAGILLEHSLQGATTTDRRLVIGIGVNVSEKPNLTEDTVAMPVQSISTVTGRNAERYDLLAPLVGGILEMIAQLPKNTTDCVNEFRARCMLSGNRVSFQDGTSRSEGDCVGIADTGELIVRTDTQRHHLKSGEANLIRRVGLV